MGEAFPAADLSVIGAGQMLKVWAGLTPVLATDLASTGGIGAVQTSVGGAGRARWAEPCWGLPRWAGMP